MASPLALTPHGSWRAARSKGQNQKAVGEGGTPGLSTAEGGGGGGQLPCPHLSGVVPHSLLGPIPELWCHLPQARL